MGRVTEPTSLLKMELFCGMAEVMLFLYLSEKECVFVCASSVCRVKHLAHLDRLRKIPRKFSIFGQYVISVGL